MKKLLLPLAALFLFSCTPAQPGSAVEEPPLDTEEVMQVMPQGGKIVDPDHGEEVWFAIGPMEGVGTTPANGVAQLHVFKDGATVQTMQMNIERAPDGFFYEGWLVNPEGGDPISSGHATSNFGDTRHFLHYTSDQDLRAYTKAVLTLERDDGNPAPAEHVAEGTLKHYER
jgi:hypothetical protein